jgi:hypothetical protein
MRPIYALTCLLLCWMPCHLQAQAPIGQWQEFLPWLPAVSVTVHADKIYCASASGLFSVTTGPEQDLTSYSKVNGLHDIGVSTTGSNDQGVLIAYRNGNLDWLSGANIYNIPDLLRKQTTASKAVYCINCYNDNAYLCTGLGIVAVDLDKREIADTWTIGSNGDYTPVYALAMLSNRYYAATAQGIKSAPVTGTNLADYRNWTTMQQGLAVDTVQQVIALQQQLICRQRSQLYSWDGTTWQPWYNDGRQITDLAVNGQTLIVSEIGRVVILGADASVQQTLQNNLLQYPLQAAGDGTDIWVADSLGGLIHYDGTQYTAIHPNGPSSIITGDLLFNQQTLYAAAGGVTDNWTPTGNTNGYYTYKAGEWQQHKDTLKDIITLAATPDGGIYAGSFGGGLSGSSGLAKPPYNVSGLATDAAGNLWVADYGAAYNLLVRKPDNTWLSFQSAYAQTGNAISQVLADDYGQIWMVSPQSNGLFVLNYNNTLENTSDDSWQEYRLGMGNLPSNDVYCLAKDHNGSIWVGTGHGIGVISCGQQATSAGCNAVLPIIQQDNFAGYLFQDEQVTTIAVDGANRKWVGSLNGAWLVSEDGTQILESFNTSNSPLPDNRMYRIAIDPNTGEVYFATGKGLMSWRGTATAPGPMTKDSVLAFPNPVPANYGGIIAIRGLADNALVKITDISGKLVFQTRSLGGQAVWSGVDYTGHRPQSGIYLVFASSDTGEHLVTKIAFIH